MSRLDWFTIYQEPLDGIGLALFLVVFPIYHGLYPIVLMRFFPESAARTRFDRYRRSWIDGILERNDFLLAAQQTRNLTMVNTVLASSSLILMGFTANAMLQLGRLAGSDPLAQIWGAHPEAQAPKLLLLIAVFAVAFAYCMTSLRHLGHFNLVVGAERSLIDSFEGSAAQYLSDLINRSSNRHTLAVRCLYSASPLFLWLFDTRLFVLLTLFWGFKFIGLQDFSMRKKKSPGPS
jgi:uncharacterized membrane protein